MKPINLFLQLGLTLAIISCSQPNGDNTAAEKPEAQKREFYQLKIYTFDSEEQIQVTDNYLKDAYLPGLKKLGISNIGIFKQSSMSTDSVKRMYVLIPLTSMDQILSLDDSLRNDATYLTNGSAYLNASYDKAPYRRVESVVIRAFEDMPNMQTPMLTGPRSNRIYELRSYESPTETYYWNKVDMFNAGGEVSLFKRLEFNAVFYGEVVSGSKMPNLMYMTTFEDQSSRDAHWAAFGDAPEWKKLIAMPKYEHNVSHADILFLYPTDYSDY